MKLNTGAMNILLIVFLFAVMWFFIIRPQRKRDKEVNAMRSSLSKGDKVVTIGGIIGTVLKVGEDAVTLQVGADRIKLEMLKSSIASVSVPAAAASKSKAKDDDAEEVSETPVNRDKKVTPKKLKAKKNDSADK